VTLTPAQEVAQKLAQLETHSQAPAADAVAGTPAHTVAPAEAVPTGAVAGTPAHDDASQPGAQAQRAATQAQQPGANCCAASEYLPDRAVAYVVDQRVQYADYFGKLPVAVIIPAYNEAERITATVQAALAIAGVERVVVVDDGSTDNTAKIAKRAGAEVISKPHKRGKGAAMGSGVAYLRKSAQPGADYLLLFVDGDLGASASACEVLIEPVASGRCSMSIAVPPAFKGAGGHGFVLGTARKAISEATGWEPQAPLSGQRCMNSFVFEACKNQLSRGWGVETWLSVKALEAGFTVLEVPCSITHRVSVNNLAGRLHRLEQFRQVRKTTRKLRPSLVSRLFSKRWSQAGAKSSQANVNQAAASQAPFEPYRMLRPTA
jgi:glycosyltransferase, family 2